jgi:hypothetical protein
MRVKRRGCRKRRFEVEVRRYAKRNAVGLGDGLFSLDNQTL